MIVVALALVSAALSAVSAAGEQRAASRLARAPRTDGRRGVLRIAGFAVALLTTPLWLVSWAVDASAFFLQAAALHLGSLSVVQPLMVSTLLFTLPLAAVERGRWPSGRDWAGAGAVSVGLALMLSARSPPTSTAAGRMLLPALGAVLAVVIVLVVASVGRPPSVRAAFLSVAAGALFGVGAATTKLTAATAATSGVVGLLTSWPGYALAVVSLASFSLQQGAYAVGPLATAMTAVVITDPLTSYFLGVVGFGEPMPDPGVPLALTALGMLVLIVGVAVLSRSSLLHSRPDRPSASAPRPAPARGQPSRERPATRPEEGERGW